MPKKIFWPASLVVMGLVFMAANMGYLSYQFWHLWPIILVVVGLGGLLTADRDEWMVKRSSRSAAKKRTVKKAPARKRKRSKK